MSDIQHYEWRFQLLNADLRSSSISGSERLYGELANRCSFDMRLVLLRHIGFDVDQLDACEMDMIIEGCDIREEIYEDKQVWQLWEGDHPALMWSFSKATITSSQYADTLNTAPRGATGARYFLEPSVVEVSISVFVFTDIYQIRNIPSPRFKIYPGCPRSDLSIECQNTGKVVSFDPSHLFSED